MKKKDLKVGQIFANKHTTPMLLLSEQVWHRTRGGRTYALARPGVRPATATLFTGPVGVLAVGGRGHSEAVVEQMEAWYEEYQQWVKELPQVFGHMSINEQSEIIERIVAVLRNWGLHLTVENYVTWKGEYTQARQAQDAKDSARDAESTLLKKQAQAHDDRLSIINSRLRDTYGVTRTKSTWVNKQGKTGIHIGMVKGVELTLEQLETILGIENGEQN